MLALLGAIPSPSDSANGIGPLQLRPRLPPAH